MSSVAKSFTAVGTSNTLAVRAGEKFFYAVSGTFVGTVVVEQQDNPEAPVWRPLVTASGSASGYLPAETGQALARVRMRCSSFTSGTIVTALADQAKPLSVVVGGGVFSTLGGDADESIPVVGCKTGDTAIVWVQKAGATPRTVDSATAGTEAVAVVCSGDPSTDHTLAYVVLRAA